MDGFTTVFLFTQEQETARVLHWSKDQTLMGGAGLVIALVAAALQLNYFRKRKITSCQALLKTLGGLLFTALWLYVWVTASLSMLKSGDDRYAADSERYQRLLDIYDRQQYKIAQGPVHVLHTQPAAGHAQGDVVQVGGAKFEVDYFSVTFGYNKTLAYGGVLTEGAQVKIYYTDEIILRIDLKE